MMESRLEEILTNSYKRKLISHMMSHPEDFDEVINLAITDKQPYSWRAAWLLWSCIEENDPRIRRHIKTIINVLPSRRDSQLRELLKILQLMEISDKDEGHLFDICVSIWESVKKQPSIRYNAFKLMVKIMKNHPELSKEFVFLTEAQYMDTLSDGVKRSISKLIADVL